MHRGGAGPRVPRAVGGRRHPGADRRRRTDAEWVEERVADPALLFRFSAVTVNAHRIHYDQPYATEVEGYPDLVVHGPLTAILLAELARVRSGRPVRGLSFRARVPQFANRSFWLTGTRHRRPAPTSPRCAPTARPR